MKRTLMLTAITALLVPLGALKAADEPTAPMPPEPDTAANADANATDADLPATPDAVDDSAIDVNDTYEEFVDAGPDNPNLVFDDVPWEPRFAARLGVWGVASSGSPYGVGEWQGLSDVTPFWDVQGLTSNGQHTLDFYANGPEDEATAAGLYFYSGRAFAFDFEYDRFIHRLGHPPLGVGPNGLPPALPDANGFPPPIGFFNPVLSDGDVTPEEPGYVMFGEDFNPGRDYAIRVQQFDARFGGNITENIKWRLNVWGMKKTGNRRANSHQHCFQASPPAGGTSRTCHVVSNSQHIDWMTTEVEPVIEARFGGLTVEYSHTLRTFQQNDQIVINDFTAAFPPYGFQTTGAYGFVPENTTNIDRIKLRADLGMDTDMYVVGHLGTTHNEFRQSDRQFYGVDARVTNSSIDGLKLTAYGKTFSQNNSEDTTSLNTRYPTQAGLWVEQNAFSGLPETPQTIYAPEPWYFGLADRDFWELGVKGRWTPLYSGGWSDGVAVTGGYEFGEVRRTNVMYHLEELTPPVVFTQPTTVRHEFFVGLEKDWSPEVNTYIRYRFIHNSWPIVGVTNRQQFDIDSAINSNLPEQLDRIEIGGTWQPSDNFLVNASLWIENASNHSAYVDFEEESYPFVLSAFYGVNDRVSLSGGYASFSNWIDQDITLGRQDGGINRGSQEFTAWTDAWRYSGRADVINLGAAYVASDDLTLTGGIEYVRGANFISNIPPNTYSETTIPERTITYDDIPNYSRVHVNVYRVTLGADYDVSDCTGVFLRYNYQDYDDIAMPWNAGAAHMFLAGVSGVY